MREGRQRVVAAEAGSLCSLRGAPPLPSNQVLPIPLFSLISLSLSESVHPEDKRCLLADTEKGRRLLGKTQRNKRERGREGTEMHVYMCTCAPRTYVYDTQGIQWCSTAEGQTEKHLPTHTIQRERAKKKRSFLPLLLPLVHSVCQ